MLILMVSCQLIFSGCSNNPTVVQDVRYIKQTIPKELLMIECQEQAAGDTVRTLAYAYVKTRSCLRAHKSLIEGLKRNYTEPEQGASLEYRTKQE